MGDARQGRSVDAYTAAFDGWRQLIDALGDDDWSKPTGCSGWDVKDQLSHVVSIERIMLGDREEPAELPEDLPHVRNEFGRFVEIGVQARRGTPPPDLVAEAHETFDRRLEQLHGLRSDWLDAEVDGPGPGMRMPGSRLLRTRTYDITTHEYDVRRAVDRVGEAPGGSHLATSIELIVRGWAKLLPSTVDRSGVLSVEVDGREVARLSLDDGQRWSGEDGPSADATIAVEVAGLLAIAGGRDDAPDVGELEVRGDGGLARAVLAAAAITP